MLEKSDFRDGALTDQLKHQLMTWAFRSWYSGWILLKVRSASLHHCRTGTILDPTGPLLGDVPNNNSAVASVEGLAEHIFLISLSKYYRWIRTVRERALFKIPADLPLDSFREACLDVRDMREHDEDYLLGRGRRQKQYARARSYRHPEYQDVRATAGWSIQIGDEYVLGNRVEVVRVVEAAADTVRQLAAAGVASEFIQNRPFYDNTEVAWFSLNWPPEAAKEALDRF